MKIVFLIIDVKENWHNRSFYLFLNFKYILTLVSWATASKLKTIHSIELSQFY